MIKYRAIITSCIFMNLGVALLDALISLILVTFTPAPINYNDITILVFVLGFFVLSGLKTDIVGIADEVIVFLNKKHNTHDTRLSCLHAKELEDRSSERVQKCLQFIANCLNEKQLLVFVSMALIFVDLVLMHCYIGAIICWGYEKTEIKDSYSYVTVLWIFPVFLSIFSLAVTSSAAYKIAK